MRLRLRKFFPIVLIALLAQIFAPIGACWAASLAASDPLYGATICHDAVASAQGQTGNRTDQSGHPGAHDGACSFCCLAHAGASVDTPQMAFTTPLRQTERVVWLDRAPDPVAPRTNSQAQARAPPRLA
jgi:hypothetical protein